MLGMKKDKVTISIVICMLLTFAPLQTILPILNKTGSFLKFNFCTLYSNMSGQKV